MENCFWPKEYGSWDYTQTEAAAAAAALQYHFYHPAAGGPPWAPPFEGAAGDRAASASRSHSEAEKRRRDRINAQLATLRKLIPKSEKMDKAALLSHVVEHVKVQSKLAKEVSKSSTIPTETDEVTVDVHSDGGGITSSSSSSSSVQENNRNNIYLKASVCCDDRPELFAEINGAIKGLALKVHHADITSIGGRMKSNLVLCKNNHSNNEENTCATTTTTTTTESLRHSLKLALSRVVISSGSSVTRLGARGRGFFTLIIVDFADFHCFQ
ncbi:hypothetical protein OROGR_011110 [Orobanche gracilis]